MRDLHALGQGQGRPGFRQIEGLGREHSTVRQSEPRQQFGFDSDRLANLSLFPRDRQCGADDQQVVDRPRHVEQYSIGFVGVPDEQPPHPDDHPHRIEEQQHHVRLGDLLIKIFVLDDTALGGHIEGAELGVDHGHGGRNQNVGREYRLIHFRPEGVPERPLQTRVRQVGQDQMRRGIGKNRQRRRIDDVGLEKQVRQGRRQEHDTRQTVEEVHHRIEVAQTLEPLQAAFEQRVVDSEYLRHAACPADALPDMSGQGLGRQPGRLRNIDVGAAPAARVHLQRSMSVLGDGFDGDASDFEQRFTTDDGAGAAEEGRIPEIVAILQQSIEQFTLVGHLAEGAQIALERVGRKEMVRRLYQRHF